MTKAKFNISHGHNQILGNISFTKAQGSVLFDSLGRDYIDFYGNASLPLGHNHEILRKVFNESIPLNIGLYSNSYRGDLVSVLSDIFPGYSDYQFYSSGSAANEGMLRYAMKITGRSKFCGFYGSFHGRTKALASVSDMEPENGERINGFFELPYPGYDPKTGRYSCDPSLIPDVDEIDSIIDEYGSDDLAGMILEPILSKPVILPPNNWLLDLKKRVLDKRGILLLADEYLTSGRVGTWMECKAQGVEPDVFSFGKCYSTGIPFGGIACLAKYATDVSKVKGNDTYGGQPAISKNVLLTLDEINNSKLIERSKWIEKSFKDFFLPLLSSQEIFRITAIGALMYVEFCSREFALKVGKICLDEGVLLAVIKCGVRLTPSLNMDESIMKEGFSRIKTSIMKAMNK